jgi:hypothetical protein
MNKFYLLLFLFSCLPNAKAQVTIGADRAPHPGAVLELESQSNHGLLLPKISLADASVWGLKGTPVEGMAVYNDNPSVFGSLKGKGFYVWAENKWHVAQQWPCTGAPDTGKISTGKTNIPANEVFQLWVDPVANASQYIWQTAGSATVVGYSNTNVISMAGLQAGSVTVSVKAVNICGTGNTQSINLTIQ